MPIELVDSWPLDDVLDLKKFAKGLIERAKENLEQDGYLQSAVFLVTDSDVHCYSVCFSGYEQKESAYDEAVQKAREFGALAIVTLNDAFIGDKDTPENYEWGQVAADPKGECIFVTFSGPGLENWTIEVEYRREPGGLVFSPPTEEEKSFIGLLGDWSKKGQRVN